MLIGQRFTLLEEFERSAAVARLKQEWAYEDDFRRIDERQRQEKRELTEREEFEAAMATVGQLAAFRDRLDRYDTAIVTALMENETARAENRARVNEMLSQAYVLPDGRHAFRSEDGRRVLDENGQEVGSDLVHPDALRGRPIWETFAGAQHRQAQLEHEQTQLIQYQQRVDHARATIGEATPSAQELNALDADLRDAMPDAVRRQLAPSPPDHNVHRDDPQTTRPNIEPPSLMPRMG